MYEDNDTTTSREWSTIFSQELIAICYDMFHIIIDNELRCAKLYSLLYEKKNMVISNQK